MIADARINTALGRVNNGLFSFYVCRRLTLTRDIKSLIDYTIHFIYLSRSGVKNFFPRHSSLLMPREIFRKLDEVNPRHQGAMFALLFEGNKIKWDFSDINK